MTTDLARLRELLAKATPGPWRVGFGDESGPTYITSGCGGAGTGVVVNGAMDSWGIEQGVTDPANAALIVALHNAAPALLDELRELRDDLREYKNACEQKQEALDSLKPLYEALRKDNERLRDALDSVRAGISEGSNPWLDAIMARAALQDQPTAPTEQP